jgi:hypothetical protein
VPSTPASRGSGLIRAFAPSLCSQWIVKQV